jgi:hypothetical protein
MTSTLRIIVTGLIAQHPLLGGMTWHYLQYVLGLQRLGHDVYYLEDSGEWPYNLHGGISGDDFVAYGCKENVKYLGEVMSRFGLTEKWAYRCPIDAQWFGLSDRQRVAVIESADLLINVSGTIARPQEYRRVHRLAYIDTDPVFTQVKLARGQQDFRRQVDTHEVHFSFGERLSGAVPATGHCWRPTRQPVVLSEWRPSTERREVFTTVMNWASYDSVTYGGQSYGGSKDLEFERFLELPGKVAPTVLEIAVRGTRKGHLPGARGRRAPGDLITFLTRQGWRIADARQVCPDFESYRRYIESSKAEWSVAKNAYVCGQAGWFSDRSACFLAAGRPVVVQDTGFAGALPIGEGILPFMALEEAAAAIREVEGNYQRHAKAARSIAEEYFDSGKVLTRLIAEALSGDGRTFSEEVRS